MSEISTLVKDKLLSSELNNNNNSLLNMDLDVDSVSNQRINESASLSSDSSNNSDIGDDAAFVEENKIKESEIKKENTEKKPNRKLRSMSDGQATSLLKSDDVDIFPSLPDSVLEKLGLYGDEERERLNEEELEQKFIALKLAFTIDAATIKDRCERQKRYRDQTEVNLNVEITKLIDKTTEIQPSSMDTEKAEHLAGLLTHIDVVVRASSLASISAERFGAVQHEARLAEAVNLMISYVTLLKQQRDSTRKQLQYTKKVLQDTNTTDVTSVKRLSLSATNGRLLTKRRASIATIAQDKCPSPTTPDSKKLTRRTSDISARVSAFARSSRPSRLELGVDLDKIKEGIVDDNTVMEHLESSDIDEEIYSNDAIEKQISAVNNTSTPPTGYMLSRIKKLYEYVRQRSRVYVENGVFHDCFYITALVCFMIGFLLLAIFLIDLQFIGVDNNSKSRHHKDEFKSKIKL